MATKKTPIFVFALCRQLRFNVNPFTIVIIIIITIRCITTRQILIVYALEQGQNNCIRLADGCKHI